MMIKVMLLYVYLSSLVCSLPNFVLLLADDLGLGDVEYNNPNSIAKTPFLNEMSRSKNTLKLSGMHSESACTPSRVAILTGRSPLRDCVWGDSIKRLPIFRKETPSIVHVLSKKYDYSTLFLGKFPIGINGKDPGGFPSALGFQDWNMSMGGPTYDTECICSLLGDCFTGHYESKYLITSWRSECLRRSSPNGDTWLAPRFKMESEVLSEMFINWINGISTKRNFFAQISFRSVHIPFVASPTLRADCDNNIICNDIGETKSSIQLDYGGTIYSLDSAIGKIRTALKSRPDWSNTILIFASDNGPEAISRNGAGNANGLLGRKQSLYEGLLKVPSMIEWPNVIKYNRKTHTIMSLMDIPITILDIVGYLKQDINAKRDGVSFLPIIKDSSVQQVRGKSLQICSAIFSQIVNKKWYCPSLVHIDATGNFKFSAERQYPNSKNDAKFNIKGYYLLNEEGFGEEINLLKAIKSNNLVSAKEQATIWLGEVLTEFDNNCKSYY